MRIGLNLLHAMPEIGGGWTYIGNLVSALGSADDRNGYVAYVTDQSAALVPPRANFRRVRIPIQPRIRSQRILAENTILQALVRRQAANDGPQKRFPGGSEENRISDVL